MLYKNILKLIGNTPIVAFQDIFIKLELFNLAGSIKDRVALKMIEALVQENKLNKNSTVIEVTSGNTGIAIAMVCAIKRYKCIIIMPNDVTKDKINIIKAYGAKVILTPKKLGFEYAIKYAKKLALKKDFVFLNQFSNPNNPLAHVETALEIIKDMPKLDYLVCGIGSGGTISMLSKTLKEHYPGLCVIGVLPLEENHQICGIGASITPEVLDLENIDKIEKVSTKCAFESFNILASNGLLLGVSSAACYNVSKRIKQANPDKIVLMISADSGMKYLNAFDELV